MEREVKVGRREATLVMSKRVPVGMPEIGYVIGTAFGEVYGYLGAHGVEPAGPPFVIYHGMPGVDDPFDVEICAPVARSAEAPQGWQVQELPAGSFATLMHVGPYDTLKASYDTVLAWLAARDLAVMGPPREVYLSEPDTPPEQVKTIIEFPVTDAAVPVSAR